MVTDPELSKHMIALLELGMKYGEHSGLTEERLSQTEKQLNLHHDTMREAIKHLGEKGALRIIGNAPDRPYGIIQAFVTDAGKLYYSQLIEESGQIVKKSVPTEIQESLETFRKDHPDSSKVGFIMMKFGKTDAHKRIMNAITETLASRGLAGVRSDDKQYHDDLYWNVLTYEYGCSFGIAVYERIEAKEFNPNVSLEVGYMLGLHKPVCLLKDRTLRKLHADLLGKLYKEFDQRGPEQTIPNELSKWLIDKNLGESTFDEAKPSDSVQMMMFARYEIETQLGRLWEIRYGKPPRPFGIRHVISQLAADGILDQSLATTTKGVYVVCSKGVHGDPLSESQIKFVRDRTSPVIKALKELPHSVHG
jgi:hypothetical protein